MSNYDTSVYQEKDCELRTMFKEGDTVRVDIDDNEFIYARLQYGDTYGNYKDRLVAVTSNGLYYIDDSRWREVIGPIDSESFTSIDKQLEEIRHFSTGAVRDTNNGKLEYMGFINPLADLSFAKYMHNHRKMKDGTTMRTSDNWQKGFPKEVLMQSLTRHVEDLKLLYQGYPIVEIRDENGTDKVLDKNMTEDEFKEHIIETLNAIRFNSEALKLQLLKE